jgi:hypothetical protein
MKKLIFIALSVVLIGCSSEPIKPAEFYTGCIVVEKKGYLSGRCEFVLKSKDSIFSIEVVKYDWDKFDYGDTIK